MILQLFLLFFAGIIIDLLVTYYTKAVAQKKVWIATSLSGVVTFVNFVLLTLIIKESSMNGVFSIMAYAGGNTVGTFFAMRKDAF